MFYYILKVLDIQPRICHIGTKGMTECIGCDMGQRFILVHLPIFLHSPTHFIFDMQRYFGLIVLIQQKETAISVHNDFCFLSLEVGKDIFRL